MLAGLLWHVLFLVVTSIHLIDYVMENRDVRDRLIELAAPFSVIGSTIASICMLLARYYR